MSARDISMTIREFARLAKGVWARNLEVRIYDGTDHIETTTFDGILTSEDNFYTLSMVRQVMYDGDNYTINLEAPE